MIVIVLMHITSSRTDVRIPVGVYMHGWVFIVYCYTCTFDQFSSILSGRQSLFQLHQFG